MISHEVTYIGAFVAGLHGHLQTTDAEHRFAGSELLELAE